MDKLPANFITLHGFLFGTIMELFLLSIALASRLKYVEKKLLAQSYLYPDVNAANFSYLKRHLPIYIPRLLLEHKSLAMVVADMKGFRDDNAGRFPCLSTIKNQFTWWHCQGNKYYY